MGKVLFVAQFPPPIHGLSKAVETLYVSPLNKKFSFSAINITNNKLFFSNLLKLLFSGSDLYYFTISQTKGGNLRDLIFFAILRLKRGKTLIHLHGGYYRTLIENDCGNFQRKLNYKAMKKISGAIILGKSLEYIFDGLVTPDKVFEVPNCVDDQYLIPQGKFNDKLQAIKAGDKIKVLYLSNFIETKGYKEVLYLAKMAKEAAAGFEFHFAGKFFESKDEEFFTSYVKEHNLHGYVHYHGIVSGQAKTDLLESCHAFTLLTRYPNEGQPISILEAMGNGMAVITTNHAGIPDIVQNGTNGLVVDKNAIDINVLYKYITEIDGNRDTLVKILENNYSSVLSNYTEKQYIGNMEAIFAKLS
ncbi:glycosyltransferase family 4 protein [Flavobacterium sp. RHBU_3]|uniref:glycosyltransferase family 4 protein n=1 Tax=Flavobacterium sp. RHBU_3 TaxID=3391184 RepID=UPI0039852A6E